MNSIAVESSSVVAVMEWIDGSSESTVARSTIQLEPVGFTIIEVGLGL